MLIQRACGFTIEQSVFVKVAAAEVEEELLKAF
jgi:hypothetical protein